MTRLLPLLVPTLAVAHPGPGHTEPTSWTHYLTEPAHVAMLVIAAVTVLAWRRVLRTEKTP